MRKYSVRVGAGLLTAALSLGLLFSGGRAQAVTYSVDDGSVDNNLGVSGGFDADLWWANGFQTVPGGEVITNIQIAFDAGGGLATGTPFQVLLYKDTDNDGSAVTGLSLLASASSTVQNLTDTFQTVDITPTTVSGGFFIAALISEPDGQFDAAIDQTTPQHDSWAAAGDFGSFDPSDVYGSADLIGVTLVDDAGFAGNFLLRANGAPASVPEPVTAELGVLSLAALAIVLASRRVRVSRAAV